MAAPDMLAGGFGEIESFKNIDLVKGSEPASFVGRLCVFHKAEDGTCHV